MSVPPEAESLIEGAPVSAHLATSVEDRPHVAPVWYGYRDGVVSFQTGGRKLANLRENPRVSLSIEDATGADVRWNVTLRGRATVVEDPERMDAASWIYEKYRAAGAEDAGDGEDPDDYALVEVTVGSASWYVYE